MLINIPRRQIIGGLLVAVLFAAMIALGLSHPSPADDSSASKASGFSPYVTKDGVGNGLRGHHFFGEAGTSPKFMSFGEVVPDLVHLIFSQELS